MTRVLPWLKGGQNNTTEPKKPSTSIPNGAASPAQRTPKRRRLSTPDNFSDVEINTTGVSTPERRRHLRPRTPSTSPPPQPPDQEPMRKGYSADDIYIMVEDEFLSTAQLFTQHLHHAEYQRLKKLAKEREAHNKDIVRAVDERMNMSDITKRELGRKAHDKKVDEGIEKVAAGGEIEDEGRDPWAGDPWLGGLMERSIEPGQVLRGLGAGKSWSRAAMGMVSQTTPTKDKQRNIEHAEGYAASGKVADLEMDEDEDEDEDEDDLDRPVKAKSIAPPKSIMRASTMSRRPTEDHKSNIFRQFARQNKPESGLPPMSLSKTRQEIEKTNPPRGKKISFDLHEQRPDLQVDADPAVTEILARRKARAAHKARQEKEKRREKEPTTSTMINEIPTFLF